MKHTATKAFKHPLIYGSMILVSGGLFANFFNFLFNLFMSRQLSVTDYGILASIVSLITFPTLIVTAVNPVIIRFAGDYFAKGEITLLRGLYKKFLTFLVLCGTVVFILFLLFLPQISQFFHIKNYPLLFLTDLIIFLSFISIINMSFIQAKLSFGFQVLVSLVISILKLLLSIVFIFLGYSVMGATGAILLSSVGGYLISFIYLIKLRIRVLQLQKFFVTEYQLH
jgi:O-antigen/teichoic acid export membrane protein